MPLRIFTFFNVKNIFGISVASTDCMKNSYLDKKEKSQKYWHNKYLRNQNSHFFDFKELSWN